MANEDCTSAKCANDSDDSWYLSQGRYPVRSCNRFTPYFCGRAAFAALADSIESAVRSIDIVTWGFDPAMLLRRDHPDYQKSYIRNEKGLLQPVAPETLSQEQRQFPVYSGWREEDAYGRILLDALKKNSNLKIRLVIWQTRKNPVVPNLIGLNPWPTLESIARDELSTGFDPVMFGGEQGLMDMLIGKKGLSDLLIRSRHPDAQKYSWYWFFRLLWQNEKKIKESRERVLDRIAVVFRSIDSQPVTEEDELSLSEKIILKTGPSDHQKCVLIDMDALPADKVTPHAYILGQNALTEYWSDFPFVHRDQRHEMDRRPFHDFALKVEGPLLIDLSHNFCEAWNENRSKELDYRMLRLQGLTSESDPDAVALDEAGNPIGRPPVRKLLAEPKEVLGKERAARYPEQEKALLVDGGEATGQIVRTRPDQNVAGHQEKDIKDAYLQAMRRAGQYVFIVNQYCQYERLIRHLKYWWRKRRESGTAADRRRTLYVLMGTCKPESNSAVFRAQQMANELGCGRQFPVANDEMYGESEPVSGGVGINEMVIDAQTVVFPKNAAGLDDVHPAEKPATPGKKGTTQEGEKLKAADYVSMRELKAMHIKPLLFMFYTRIPQAAEKASMREEKVAQQPYVHAKLCVVDDQFFTLGSANLNIRSMAVDSELNLISDDCKTARALRDHLWRAYVGLADPDLPQSERARLERIFSVRHETLTPARMEAIYRTFKRVMDANTIRIRKGLPIQGSIARFRDDRGVVGIVRTG